MSQRGVYRAKRCIDPMAIMVLIALLLPSMGGCESATEIVHKLLGSHMNDVAVQVAELPEKVSDAIVRGLDFSPDGKQLAEEWGGDHINIWDWKNQKIDHVLKKPYGGNDIGVSNPVHFSPDGRYFANCEQSGEHDVVIRIWNATDWSIAKDIMASEEMANKGVESRGGCTGMVFTPDAKMLIRTSDAGNDGSNQLIVYSVGDWQAQWGLKWENFSPKSIAVSPDGTLAAVAGIVTTVPENARAPDAPLWLLKRDPTIFIVNLQQRKMVRTIQSLALGPMAWSLDGTRLAIVSGSVEIFDAHTGQKIMHDEIKSASSMNARFTADGKYYIEADSNYRGSGLGVKIWDAKRSKLFQHIALGDAGSIAVSRDSKYLAVGETGRTTIWQFK